MYRRLGVFLLQYSPLVNVWNIMHFNCLSVNIVDSKNKKHLSQYSVHNAPLGHHTGHGPRGLRQCDGLGEYMDLILPSLCLLL